MSADYRVASPLPAGGDGDDAEASEAAAPEDAAPEIRRATVDAALHGERLDKALVALAPEFSRSHLQSLIEAGHVRIDDQPATTASRRLRAAQHIEVELVPTAESQA